jgi:hypothetical protein
MDPLKVACSIRNDIRELLYFSMIFSVSGCGERPPWSNPLVSTERTKFPKDAKVLKGLYVKNALANISYGFE